MICPECDSPLRSHSLDGGQLFTRHCPQHGHWIPGFLYWQWLNQTGRISTTLREESLAPIHSSSPAQGAILCQDCSAPLKRENVGRGLRYRASLCAQCGGMWLHPSEWERLLDRDPATEIRSIFHTIWRRDEERQQSKKKHQVSPSSPIGSGDPLISKRKAFFPVTERFQAYLAEYRRSFDFAPVYEELGQYESSYPCMDKDGEDTLWQTLAFPPARMRELNRMLSRIYSQLKTGDPDQIQHIYIERVDYCDFGNSKPFRVRVVNEYNDNHDHFYVKTPDASRIYGLELEHILSPNRINYIVHPETLIEEHIAGIPGDLFIREYITEDRHLNRVRLAKEFVKFNERCFIRLLGDMRSYNYVVEMTPDFEEVQFRVRAIDFDQQSYEGNPKTYLPQFFKENNQVVKLCTTLLNYQTMQQYQVEERTLIARRVETSQQRLIELFACMELDELSTEEKIGELAEGLSEHHRQDAFSDCKNMGAIVRRNLELMLGVSFPS